MTLRLALSMEHTFSFRAALSLAMVLWYSSSASTQLLPKEKVLMTFVNDFVSHLIRSADELYRRYRHLKAGLVPPKDPCFVLLLLTNPIFASGRVRSFTDILCGNLHFLPTKFAQYPQ